MGKTDQTRGFRASAQPDASERRCLRNHSPPWDANRGESEVFGDRRIVKAHQWRNRTALLPAIQEQRLRKTVVAGENSRWPERENFLSSIETS